MSGSGETPCATTHQCQWWCDGLLCVFIGADLADFGLVGDSRRIYRFRASPRPSQLPIVGSTKPDVRQRYWILPRRGSSSPLDRSAPLGVNFMDCRRQCSYVRRRIWFITHLGPVPRLKTRCPTESGVHAALLTAVSYGRRGRKFVGHGRPNTLRQDHGAGACVVAINVWLIGWRESSVETRNEQNWSMS